jgi:glucans biosynthesis protein
MSGPKSTGAQSPRPQGAQPDAAAIARMLGSRRCGALTRSGDRCRAPAVKDKLRCRKHGGGICSGAPKGNRNARKHGLYSAEERAEHRRIMDFVRQCNRVLDVLDGPPAGQGASRSRSTVARTAPPLRKGF